MENSKRTCIVTNIGPHYRYPIFSAIARRFHSDFYFGDRMYLPIKTFDYDSLEGYRGTLRNHFIGPFYWQSGALRLAFKPYDIYFFDGEPFNLSSWLMLLVCRAMGKRCIAWTHGWYGRESGLKRVVKKLYFSLYTELMVYNEYSIHLMEKEGIKAGKMFCIANALDSDKDLQIRVRLRPTSIYKDHFGNNYPTIIYCGRIQKWKRLDLILSCVARLKAKGTMVNVVFLGKDVDNVGLDRIAAQKGIESQVWLFGPCYDEAVIGEMFYNASLCLSPGNVGLTAIHALSFGCPVVTHGDFKNQNPEFDAIKPGVTGDFFKAGNLGDMTEKVLNWINKDSDARERTRAEAFKEIDTKWNIHYQIKIIEKVINER